MPTAITASLIPASSIAAAIDAAAPALEAAVIAVPTLLAGVWGMNFSHMPELDSVIGYPIALVSIFGSGALVRWKLRRNGWF